MAATEWLVISDRDLEGERLSGGFIRAFCHIHGGDNQRSLSINNDTGFGQCHNCGAQVLVREINPDAALNIERGQARLAEGDIRVVDPKYIVRAAGRPKTQRTPTIATWQREEITLLRALQDSMQSRLTDERAHAYIAGRGLSLDTALASGVGYIPDVPLTGKYAVLARWDDHIIFPVQSPTEGLQFAGRSLRLWVPGMDETQHKNILETKEQEFRDLTKAAKERGQKEEEKRLAREAGLYRRWCKTYANGWFNFHAMEQATHVTFCEGAFDALALIEAGISHAIAVIGTALSVDWTPPRIEHITLAFDGDKSGIEKCANARATFYEHGYDVTICHAPDDSQGKDWSERYRLHGRGGLALLLEPPPPIEEPHLVKTIDYSCSVCNCPSLRKIPTLDWMNCRIAAIMSDKAIRSG